MPPVASAVAADEPSESYIASSTVGVETREYCGAARVASGGAVERRDRIELGMSGAYLRPKGAKCPNSPVTLDDGEVRQHTTFGAAAVEEVLNFGLLRLKGRRVRGGPWSNVKWTPAQKSEVARLERALRPVQHSRALARAAIIELASDMRRLKCHIEDRCFSCAAKGHYQDACAGFPYGFVRVVARWFSIRLACLGGFPFGNCNLALKLQLMFHSFLKMPVLCLESPSASYMANTR